MSVKEKTVDEMSVDAVFVVEITVDHCRQNVCE